MNLLVVGDTLRTPELRHEVPLGIPDAFFYAEVDGRKVVVISSMRSAARRWSSQIGRAHV